MTLMRSCNKAPKNPRISRKLTIFVAERGFALVAVIVIMVLISLLAIGLLGLSTISTRTSDRNVAMAEARANARLALNIAIGELQRQFGPDQRISANSSILSDSVPNARWLGAWDSWKAGESTPAGNDEPSEHSTIENYTTGMAPSYEPKREDHFRAWLLSLNETTRASISAPQTVGDLSAYGSSSPSIDDRAVELVGANTLGPDAEASDLVYAQLIEAQNGRYAWWVGDESQKANVMDDSYQEDEPDNRSEKLYAQQAPASFGNSEINGLDNIGDQEPLSFIPTRNTLALIGGVSDEITEEFHNITTRSLGVLADVREGGLKRDLSTILERPIDPNEVYNFTSVEEFQRATSLKPEADDFMLYRFDNLVDSISPTGEANVPIQDLAAYYQLYDNDRSEFRSGIQFTSRDSSPPNSNLTDGIMVSNPDYGETQSDIDKYLREYTALYRAPVLVKVEMILSYVAEPIFPIPTTPTADKYNLRVGVSPAVTFWNPNNVPMVLNIGDPDRASIMLRETAMPLRVTLRKSNSYNGAATATSTTDFTRITHTQQGELYTLFVSGNYPTVFEPGECKTFALRFASNTDSNSASNYVDFMLRGGRGTNRFSERFFDELELAPGWNPEKFIRPTRDAGNASRADPIKFSFKDGDYISATITAGNSNSWTLDWTQKSRHGRNSPGVKWHFRSGRVASKFNGDNFYKNSMIYQGFPPRAGSAPAISDRTARTIEIEPREANKLIQAMGSVFNPRDDLPQPFFYYSLKAGTETHELENNAPILGGAARRFPQRPFTHSTTMVPAMLDDFIPSSQYNYGWNWFFMPLDNMLDAPVEISGSNSGYYGGGYTAENGTTHIVQQHLPVVPPISIATLSHAHLGGYSLATEAPAAGYQGLRNPTSYESFRRTTAIGYDGLAPHTLQAIGNSYAHPNISADRAFKYWNRRFVGNNRTREPFVDHSYLANKALWDEFYFSSITPKPANEIYERNRFLSAQEVAQEYFFGEEVLPNRRLIPYKNNLTEEMLDDLLATYSDYREGFADKVAAHMMVEGPFNVNSTSVEAWKALFASLKEYQISYLDAQSALVVGQNLDYDEIDGVPIPGGPLPNGKAYQGSSSDPSDADQWTGFRELTDDEIEELAEAMVEQVKLRGPFLSLSDFVNRRLDRGNTELALKGALQAALDDPDVSINEGFRQSPRQFTDLEYQFMDGDSQVQFEEALEGPVAYGSAAYVDQADILRGLPAQLTPRGDTFVIRTYGDSIDANGNVVARAWCEALVQRVPEYVDPTDEPETKQDDLESEVNEEFGRKFVIAQFRWLNSNEI